MSPETNNISRTDSRASSTRSSIFARASGFVLGSSSRRNPHTSTGAQPKPSSSTPTPSPKMSSNNGTFADDFNSQPGSSSAAGPRKFDHIFPAPDPSVQLTQPAPLSNSQQDKYDQMLQHFKSTTEYPTSLKSNADKKPLDEVEIMRNLSRESMIRYLRATKWDVAAAQKRLTDTIAWRREYGVDTFKAEDLEPEAMTGKETILGYDNKGRPLHYMHPSRNTTEETPRQMQFAVWILERAIDLMPPGVEMLALLINFGGRKRNPTSISNAKLMLYILQNHYVERLGIALCINVPWIFKAFWNAIYPFIDPVTKGKCKFDEAIKDEVPNAQLASDFGGLLDFPYEHDTYWPQLVELTNRRREEQMERFRTLCNSEIGASEWVIRGGDELGRSTKPEKQDSGFVEAGSPEAERAAAKEKPSPLYISPPGESAPEPVEQFYTSTNELPPTIANSPPSDSGTTVVHDEYHPSPADVVDLQASIPVVSGTMNKNKHGDANLFAAVVGGIGASLGHKDAHNAADEAGKHADKESRGHEKHPALKQIKAVFHRKSEDKSRPAVSAK